ncbi:carboxypeptidase-like regulatory domain-containing protein [Hymenobacter busanensis]|uniref:Carboxypeptidase-like regulatory domain-containing protein n=1 Tax=Hymenobacter busanensis TaxID=2607656 RepID=A0A7L4ZZU4_9BACT|nr:DUF5686 and carboxypeptidase-like regulatory domain-containing protein [Hymenobacter busanensis]KAA9333030.1 carboxypeptidase-like regulatory domain-containing protein [Hymenobacter busanensis]QHJ08295.1 carboxypeptidase-like regulatory domain-containing protein [Hymenobacter busanensis]
MRHVYPLLCLFALLLLGGSAAAQRMAFSGRVTEAATGQPVPFASVYVKGTTLGTTADEEGRYQLPVPQPVDSLWASAVGFRPKSVAVGKQPVQTVNLALPSAAIALGEVTIRPTENPAYAILRQVQQHKPQNDRRRLDDYDFDSYTRLEAAFTDLPERIAKQRLVQQIQRIADAEAAKTPGTAGNNLQAALPIFASETESRCYVRNQPVRRREEIRRSQLRGAAPEPGSFLAQMTGSSFQDFDFYPNWQQCVGKDFISPIAEGWRITYDYDLEDSVLVGQDRCYQLKVTPRRPQDLAFTGRIWITTGSFALRKVDLMVDPRANLNFVSELSVQQELTSPTDGPGLPVRTRVVVGFKPSGDGQLGARAVVTTVNSHFLRNQNRPLAFYAQSIETAVDAYANAAEYFAQSRPDTLSVAEKQTLAVLDSVTELPAVHSIMELADIVVNGYKRVGKIDVGPLLTTFGFNNVEGVHTRLGLRTTPEISPTWLLGGFVGYGFRDQRVKYNVYFNYMLNRRHWTVLSLNQRRVLDQVALLDVDLDGADALYEASARVGNLDKGRPLLRDVSSVKLQTDVLRGLTQSVMLRRQHFDPLFGFRYFNTPEHEPTSPTTDELSLAEVVLETRYARDERLISLPHRRYAVGQMLWPVFTLRYTLGLNNLLGGDFRYHKFNLLVTHSARFGQLGRTDYRLEAGLIPNTVPYPVLKSHLGNQNPFYNSSAFNLMRYFEFVSDRYASVRAEHHFEGLFLNSVPLLKKLNWRLLATGSVLYGGARPANLDLIPAADPFTGEALPKFRPLGTLPYAEVGYGVENIFKFVRVDFIHRLTYRNLPGVQNFGVKMSFQFKL